MLGRLFRRAKVASVPPGYPSWSTEGFQERFKLTTQQAEQVRAAYLAILASDETNGIAQVVIQSHCDMQRLVGALNSVVDVHGGSATEVGVWLTRIRRIRGDQLRRPSGVRQCTWQLGNCGQDPWRPFPMHRERDGVAFDGDLGFPVTGGYELPGTEVRCNCTARPILSWMDDH